MIQITYDRRHNAVVIEFSGKIDAEQGEQYLPKIPKVIPKHGRGFALLVDLSSVESMDPKVQDTITKAMDLFNAAGVTRVIRVNPDPDRGIGFNILSIFHYAKNVKILTLPSRAEAMKRLMNNSSYGPPP